MSNTTWRDKAQFVSNMQQVFPKRAPPLLLLDEATTLGDEVRRGMKRRAEAAGAVDAEKSRSRKGKKRRSDGGERTSRRDPTPAKPSKEAEAILSDASVGCSPHLSILFTSF